MARARRRGRPCLPQPGQCVRWVEHRAHGRRDGDPSR
jgi:hypothetical protein